MRKYLGRSSKKDRMSEGTWNLVEERRELKARIESAKTRREKLTSTRLYQICRRDKRERIDSIAHGAAAAKKDMKKAA